MLNSTTYQVDGISKTSAFKFTEKAGFFLTSNAGDEPPARPATDDIFTPLVTAGDDSIFWQLLIEDYTEVHSDAVNVLNTFANASVIQAMGATPVQVSVKGAVYTTVLEDHRVDFLKVYNEIYRGSLNWEYDVIVNFFVKDTYMRLFFTAITVSNRSDMEDMTGITFTGLGFKYKCI